MEDSCACVKCGYKSKRNKKNQQVWLCEICNSFVPLNNQDLERYLSEKMDWRVLTTFRKYSNYRGEKQKRGMIEQASKGNSMSRAAFGYKIEERKLIPSEDSLKVQEIFKEFLNTEISLTQLAKKNSLSINGLKKILSNFTYIGKIKFNNQMHDGEHEQIVSPMLFNHVQNKLEKLGIKI